MIEQYQDFQTNRNNQRHDWNIDRFCRNRGIKQSDLHNHPQWSDLVLLIRIRSEFSAELAANPRLRGVVDAYWGHTYQQRYPLRPKGLRKLEKVVTECQQIKHNQQQIITRIRSLRGSATPNNIGQDNKAKGPCLPPVTSTKREPQECRQMPEDPAWVPW